MKKSRIGSGEDEALHTAVAENRFSDVFSLIIDGADVDKRNKEDKAPIHIAVEKRLSHMIKILILTDCNVEASFKNCTPRHMIATTIKGPVEDEILGMLDAVSKFYNTNIIMIDIHKYDVSLDVWFAYLSEIVAL